MRIINVMISFLMVIGCFSYVESSVLFFSSNYAPWSFVHYGTIIDSSGAIRNYNFALAKIIAESANWDIPTRINKLLENSTPTGQIVAADTLLSMKALIEPASKGVVSFGPGGCPDAANIRYGVLLYDSLNSRREEIVCFQMGSQPGCNSADAAKTIARWLNALIDSSSILCAPPDSCLHPATSIHPAASVSHLKIQFTPSAAFHLNGKKAQSPARQLTVNKKGKILIDLK